MKTLNRHMKKLLLGPTIFLLTLLIAAAPNVALSQDAYGLAVARLVAAADASYKIGDDSTVQPAVIVFYAGTAAAPSGLVAVDAGTGDLTMTSGAAGSEAAEADFECPVSGALGGVIDVSNAACNTLGEVVDTINGECTGCAGTSSKWRAVIVAGLRADSSNDTLVTIAATSAANPDGLKLAWDTDVALHTTIAVLPPDYLTMGPYLGGTNKRLVANPYQGQIPVVQKWRGLSTYGSGTSAFTRYSVKVNHVLGDPGSETVTTIYSEASGATTVDNVEDYSPYGTKGRPGEKTLLRIVNSAAMATTDHAAYGFVYKAN